MPEPTEERTSFSEFLTQMAGKAGLHIAESTESMVTLLFDMGDDRSQTVWVRALGVDALGNMLVGFFSPALKIPAGQMLGQKAANDLLRDNATLAHGAWAIEKSGEEEYLVVYDTQIAQTMDPDEFEASVRGVAATADAKEKDLGVDVF